MKKLSKISRFLILAATISLLMTSCLGFLTFGSSRVTIRVSGGLSSVRPGGTLQFTATGRDIIWSVSSTADGSGPVSSGTFITSSGLFTVSINETYIIIYIIATSRGSGESEYIPIRVTTVTNVSVSPNNQSTLTGRTLQFTASVTGSNNPDNNVTWRVNGALSSGTNINASGRLTVAPTETATTLSVTATSVIDPSRSGNAIVTVLVPTVTRVDVYPPNQQITTGRTLQFSASVYGTNSPSNDVTWRVAGALASGTNINANGLLTVAPNETATTLFITATSVVDSSRSGNAVISVLVPIITGVIVSPSSQQITAGGAIQFTASVTGTNNPGNDVTWRVTGAYTSGTNINANGWLTVAFNETATTLFITATSIVDPSRSGNAVVTVIPSAAQPPVIQPPVIQPPSSIVTSVIVNPQNQSVERGRAMQFNASVIGVNNPSNAVTWRVSSNASGTGAVTSGTGINNNGLLSVSANESVSYLYVIATSMADPTKSGSAMVTVIRNDTNPNQPPDPTVNSVTVNPSSQSVNRGGNLQFNATVTGANNPSTAVTWRVSSNTAGTGAVASGTSINSNGRLTVSSNETNTTLYVIAASTADTTKTGIATVTVTAPAPNVTGVTVSPSGQSIERGRSAQFNASVIGSNNPSNAVTWRVSSNAAGTGAVASGTSISPYGVLTISANETASVLYVIATSTADTTKSGSVTVTVTAPVPTVIGVTVSPSNQSVDRGRTLQFSATVAGTGAGGSPSNAVTWRVSSNASGTGAVASGTSINSSGRLTVSSNETASTLYIIATSVADPTKSGSVTVTVRRGGNQDDQGQNNNRQ